MPRHKETITLSIEPGTKEKLEAIATQLGISWGGSPSVSGLVAAIAEKNPKINKLLVFSPAEKEAILRAINLLANEGYLEKAKSLLDLCEKTGNLDSSSLLSLKKVFLQPSFKNYGRLKPLIEQQQTFEIVYCSAFNQLIKITVKWAELDFRDQRYWLKAWATEAAQNSAQTFPELAHNYLILLNDIQSIVPLDLSWRHEGLDFVKICLHLYRDLADYYQPHSDDIESELIGGIRQVVRKMFVLDSTIKEIANYWENCLIIYPDSLKAEFIKKLKRLNQLN